MAKTKHKLHKDHSYAIPIKKPMVLIIDDDDDSLKLIAKHIGSLDCDITISNSAQKAVDYLANEECALILADVIMPQMDGLKMISQVKDISMHKYTPVIFITGQTDNKDILIEGYKLGAVDVINKPYNKFILQSKVKVLLDLYRKKKEIEYLLEQQQNLNKELTEVHEELNRKNLELDKLARFDTLTKLSNRRDAREKMHNEVIRSLRNRRKFCVILGDIDRFKEINDTWGHECGDLVLKTVSDLMRTSIRRQDLVSRWGGEEFLLMLPETDKYGGKAIAEKLREKIQLLQIVYKRKRIPVTISFGIAEFNRRHSLNETIRIADEHLYKAKKIGRNCVYA